MSAGARDQCSPPPRNHRETAGDRHLSQFAWCAGVVSQLMAATLRDGTRGDHAWARMAALLLEATYVYHELMEENSFLAGPMHPDTEERLK